jgi:hypothetical protein
MESRWAAGDGVEMGGGGGAHPSAAGAAEGGVPVLAGLAGTTGRPAKPTGPHRLTC